ncbi:uncharacterized protein J8A68_005867 [[Candida] subhashii]|uniref:Transcriptional protein SWT1 n=1 Tax=[Candida] subhashii TaxID=561895 RepID=A0A8J5UIY9_9ASCO|nr:uncharacterized protein J8A68_005867 [[Candida] subhashii]KAG7660601.1 hypothetical protein J8A68_005867 [[Candida] subhashii]
MNELPSKYSSVGLSPEDQHKVITSGPPKRPRKPIEYTIRTIESKIQDAVTNQTYQNSNYIDEDIEMVPMDTDKEVDAISSYIAYCRDSGNLSSHSHDEYLGDDMMIDEHHNNITELEIIEGNISFLVVDTNFIISHLQIIDELRELAIEFGLKIILPIPVIQELDGLKNSTKIQSNGGSGEMLSGVSVGHLARWANEWIYTSLANSSTVVKGQKLSQRIDRDAMKDDAILDCCIYFKQTHPHNLVVLLSNDKNLCSKALMNDMLTVSFRKDMTAELIASMIFNQNINTFGKLETKVSTTVHHQPAYSHAYTSPPPQQQQQQKHLEPSKEWIEAAQDINGFQSFSEISSKVYNEIETILSSALHHCMKAEFGDDLDLIRDYDNSSGKTIAESANVLIRFWFPVFQPYFSPLPGNFKPFEETGSGKSSHKTPIFIQQPTTIKELYAFVEFWSTVLDTIYDAIMGETEQQALEVLTTRWKKMASSSQMH